MLESRVSVTPGSDRLSVTRRGALRSSARKRLWGATSRPPLLPSTSLSQGLAGSRLSPDESQE